MALQGQLQDFSASEILQLLGTQKKTGSLALERAGERCVVHVLDGRIVSTRSPGMAKDDPLLAFLRGVHRLSEEQVRGITSIQRETGRDLEDLLLNGRYLGEEELAACVERQILDDIMRVTRWEQGVYHFDPHVAWPNPPLVRLSIEGVIMEAARRADERRRYDERLGDANTLLVVRDLPDPAEPLTEEERELFGIIDGRHTIAEVIQAAPLTDYETREALFRFVESGWVEVAGRRDPATPVPVPMRGPERPAPSRPGAMRDVIGAMCAVGLVLGLRALTPVLFPPPAPGAHDLFVEMQMRDVRDALALYRRQHGVYPQRLEQLADDQWVTAAQLQVNGAWLHYRVSADRTRYGLSIDAGESS